MKIDAAMFQVCGKEFSDTKKQLIQTKMKRLKNHDSKISYMHGCTYGKVWILICLTCTDTL